MNTLAEAWLLQTNQVNCKRRTWLYKTTRSNATLSPHSESDFPNKFSSRTYLCDSGCYENNFLGSHWWKSIPLFLNNFEFNFTSHLTVAATVSLQLGNKVLKNSLAGLLWEISMLCIFNNSFASICIYCLESSTPRIVTWTYAYYANRNILF